MITDDHDYCRQRMQEILSCAGNMKTKIFQCDIDDFAKAEIQYDYEIIEIAIKLLDTKLKKVL